jgi:hypothetical protein
MTRFFWCDSFPYFDEVKLGKLYFMLSSNMKSESNMAHAKGVRTPKGTDNCYQVIVSNSSRGKKDYLPCYKDHLAIWKPLLVNRTLQWPTIQNLKEIYQDIWHNNLCSNQIKLSVKMCCIYFIYASRNTRAFIIHYTYIQ